MAAAGTGLVAAENQLGSWLSAMELIEGGKSVSRTTGRFRSGIPSVCKMCEAGCGIIGFIEEGRIVKIGGNPRHLNNRGRLCAKGQAGVNFQYDPDRLRKPLKRTGARGEGKWKEISWEQALSELTLALKTIRDSGRPQEFVFHSRDSEIDGLVTRFLDAFGTPSVIGNAGLKDANRRVALQLTWGANQAVPDVANTKYMLLLQANPYEDHPLYVSFAQRMIDGLVDNAAKLVVFSSRLNNTMVRINEGFNINPGGYGLLALAMAKVIMQEGLYDTEFIEKWTNVSVKQLSNHLEPYSPEFAEERSGVKAAVIRRVAIEFATTKPAVAITDAEIGYHANGTQAERAVMLLNAITGNIDVRGGCCLPRQFALTEPDPVPPKPSIKSELVSPAEYPLAFEGVSSQVLPMIREGRQKVALYMVYRHNPVYSGPDCDQSISILKDDKIVPYIVVADSFMTETAALADLVLPVATYLESWGLEPHPSMEMVPFIALRQPVVRPPAGESKIFEEVLLDLAGRLKGGLEQYMNFQSMEDYFKAKVSKVGGLNRVGGLQYLERYGIWFDPTVRPVYKSYEQNGFATPSGKFEIYSPRMETAGFAAWPTHEPIAVFQNPREEDLILTVFQPNVHTGSRTGNCMWLSEILHDNGVWLSAKTAEEHGIKEKDKVKITVQGISGKPVTKTIIARARLTEGINPRVIAMADGTGHWEYGRIARAENFDSDDPNTHHIWWDKFGNGVNPRKIIQVKTDPVGGGQAWFDVIVQISKA